MNCTSSETLNTHTQPRINQIKEKIERNIVENKLQQIPPVATTVNVTESETKHRNVLKKKYLFLSIEYEKNLVYKIRRSESPTSTRPTLPATII